MNGKAVECVFAVILVFLLLGYHKIQGSNITLSTSVLPNITVLSPTSSSIVITSSARIQTTSSAIAPTSVTSTVTPTSSIGNSNTTSKPPDPKETFQLVTMCLLIACVVLFVFIVAVLIVLVIQMKNLSKKIRK